uniref:DUF6438 domain-containing protein n=1 Tax=Roseihalotalea indica TaxID=2867963 RepID=A0AA49GT24_9BACT|nr:DUF6438 domain-containing protein [Tunicatimonas sp. TK19036]
MKEIITIIGMWSICACAGRVNQDQLTLEGDWIYIKDSSEISTITDAGLRFSNDTLLPLGSSMFWPSSHYILKQDSIIFEDFDGKKSFYLILNHQPDSLTLSLNGHIERYYNRQLEYNSRLQLDSIILKTGWCFGDCPEFTMTFHPSGSSQFRGIRDTKFIGERKLTVERDRLNKIDSLFKWSYIDHLDTTEYYSAIDGWSTGIILYYNENQVKRVEGTMMNMPFRLKPIIWELVVFLKEEKMI